MFSNYAKPISFSGSVKPDVTITLKDIFLQQVLNYGIWYAKAEANLAQNFRTGCAGHLIYFFQACIVFFLWRRTSWMNGRFLLPLGLLRVLKKKEGCRMEWASEQRRPAAHAWIEGLQWRQDSSPADFGGEGKNFLRTRAEKAEFVAIQLAILTCKTPLTWKGCSSPSVENLLFVFVFLFF